MLYKGGVGRSHADHPAGEQPLGEGKGDVRLQRDRSTELPHLGSYLAAARLERGLSQAELAARCDLSQAQVSYFELGRRRPTLDQLVRIARSLDVSIEKLIAGCDRPGDGLRDIAIELRHLGLVDLWVDDPIVPGAFRRPEEVIAKAVSGREPDPRILEAIPAALAWNRINPVLLRAYGLTTRPRVTRRLAWLADIALAIDRRGGFPGGCRKETLARFTRMTPAPPAGSDDWDSLGRPTASTPPSPIWKRWRINYDADLAQFEQRARHLDELRGKPGSEPRRGLSRRGPVAPRSRKTTSGGRHDGT
jgi:transcriptional regulator with XRE-family HTH domain